MADELKPETEPKAVTVTVSASTMGTGPGTIVTAAGQANIVVKVVQPFVIVGVRAMRVFLQTLLGLTTAGLVTPKALPAQDFVHLLVLCASLSVAPAVICVLQNVGELLAKFDQSHPTLAG